MGRRFRDYGLYIFDFYDTLVIAPNGEAILRRGARNLLDRLKKQGKKIAISSDSDREDILHLCERFDIRGYISRVYGKEHLFRENGYVYKDLEKVCKDFKIKEEACIMVGDNYKGTDERSANRFGVRLIEVPDGREDPDYALSDLFWGIIPHRSRIKFNTEN